MVRYSLPAAQGHSSVGSIEPMCSHTSCNCIGEHRGTGSLLIGISLIQKLMPHSRRRLIATNGTDVCSEDTKHLSPLRMLLWKCIKEQSLGKQTPAHRSSPMCHTWSTILFIIAMPIESGARISKKLVETAHHDCCRIKAVRPIGHLPISCQEGKAHEFIVSPHGPLRFLTSAIDASCHTGLYVKDILRNSFQILCIVIMSPIIRP